MEGYIVKNEEGKYLTMNMWGIYSFVAVLDRAYVWDKEPQAGVAARISGGRVEAL